MSKKIEAPFHCEMAASLQRKARAVLRKEIAESPDWETDDTHADCIIEQVWNALVGHDKIKPSDT